MKARYADMGKIFKGITALVLAAAVMFTSAPEASASGERRWKASLNDPANDVVISTDKKAINDELVQYGMYHGPFLFMFPIEYGPDLYFRKGETFKIETSYDKKYISKFWDDTTIVDLDLTKRHRVEEYRWEYNKIVSPGYLPKIDAGLTYTSSDTSVAKVTKKGKIKAVGYGNATVTVSVTNQDIISKVGEGMRKHLTFTLNVHVRKKKSIVKGKYCSDYTKEYIDGQKIGHQWRLDYNNNYKHSYPTSNYGWNGEYPYEKDYLNKSEWKKAVKKFKKYLNSLYGKWLDGIITTKEADNLIRQLELYINFSNCPGSFTNPESGGQGMISTLQAARSKRAKWGTFVKVIKLKNWDYWKLDKKIYQMLMKRGGTFRVDYHNMRIYKKGKYYYAYLMMSSDIDGGQYELGEKFFGFERNYYQGDTDDEDEWHVSTYSLDNCFNADIYDKLLNSSLSSGGYGWNDKEYKIVDRNGERIIQEQGDTSDTSDGCAYVY